MANDEWNEESVFSAALEFDDADARAAFLDRICRANRELRQNVEQLLRHFDDSHEFLESPAFLGDYFGEPERVGERVGNYILREAIGEGGFGTVYRAEQMEPVQRTVALKIVRLGVNAARIVERFEAERQALASLHHPHIATVLDAGETAAGRPFIVMELVDGSPIDRYCDELGLSIVDRLRLFLGVCDAVQHAHQKSLVHLDLKPTNILVSTVQRAGAGIPKVIDFGIAKALQRPPSPHDSHSDGSEMPAALPVEIAGTPHYMSPEQMQLSDVDTRADIYGLGSVLYKLLTGTTPRQKPPRHENLTATGSNNQLDAILPPSQRVVERVDETASLPRIDGIRAAPASAARLRRELRGDLDRIVLKSLATERADRYATVSDLAADIQRFLRNEPISAGPTGRGYRLRKFAVRNRLAVAAGGFVLTAIVAGGLAATLGMWRADRARREAELQWARAEERTRYAEQQRQLADRARIQAELEKQNSDQLANVLERLIGASDPEQGHPADYTLRQLLDDSVDELLQSLQRQPEIEARLRRAIARAYWNLGDQVRAGPHFERAHALWNEILPPEQAARNASQAELALYLSFSARLQESEDILKRALPGLAATEPTDEYVTALVAMSRVHDAHGRVADAAQCTQDALQAARRIHGSRSRNALWVQSLHAFSLMQLRQRDAAESLADATFQDQMELFGEENAHVAFTKYLRGLIAFDRGDRGDAEPLLRQALQTHSNLLGRKSFYCVLDLLALANLARESRRPAEAEELAREAVSIAEQVSLDGQSLRVKAYRMLATVLRFRDRETSAEMLKMAIESQRSISTSHAALYEMLERRGAVLRELGRLDEAIDCYREGVSLQRTGVAVRDHLALQLHGLANTLCQLGRTAEALSLLVEAVEVSPPQLLLMPIVWLDCIDTLLEQGELDRAKEISESMARHLHEYPNPLNEIGLSMVRAAIAIADRNLEAAQAEFDAAARSPGSNTFPRAVLRWAGLRAQLLIAQGELDAAESRLLAIARLNPGSNAFSADDSLFLFRRIAALYEAWNKPEEAAQWRAKLATRLVP